MTPKPSESYQPAAAQNSTVRRHVHTNSHYHVEGVLTVVTHRAKHDGRKDYLYVIICKKEMAPLLQSSFAYSIVLIIKLYGSLILFSDGYNNNWLVYHHLKNYNYFTGNYGCKIKWKTHSNPHCVCKLSVICTLSSSFFLRYWLSLFMFVALSPWEMQWTQQTVSDSVKWGTNGSWQETDQLNLINSCLPFWSCQQNVQSTTRSVIADTITKWPREIASRQQQQR